MMLNLPAIILLGLGFLISLIGGIWMLVIAFRRSLVWGLCYLFVPLAALVFIVVAWADAKRAFLVNTIGVLLMASVFLLPNQGGLDLKKRMALDVDPLGKPSPAVPGAVVRVSTQDRLAELTAREQTLRARKAALDPQDLAGARALTDDILKYNADLKAVTDEQAALESTSSGVVSYKPGTK